MSRCPLAKLKRGDKGTLRMRQPLSHQKLSKERVRFRWILLEGGIKPGLRLCEIRPHQKGVKPRERELSRTGIPCARCRRSFVQSLQRRGRPRMASQQRNGEVDQKVHSPEPKCLHRTAHIASVGSIAIIEPSTIPV